MNINGAGNIQAARDVILNIIATVRAPEDISQAIADLHAHIDRLQRRRGLIDARIFLAVLVAVFFIVGIKLWNIWTPVLFSLSIILIFIGTRIRMVVSKIDIEIVAANFVLTELYKHKIINQVGGGL